MKRLFLREEAAGKYSIRGFGANLAGADGKNPFHLVIESRSRDLLLEFPETFLFDLFTHFDLKAPAYLENRFVAENLVQIAHEERECVIQANSGTLYDFFKERAATGNCVMSAAKPISFYWKGSTELDAA
ncbi:MAG: hypothetical protein ACXVBE_17770 [Bdellovibrionota bacterium]